MTDTMDQDEFSLAADLIPAHYKNGSPVYYKDGEEITDPDELNRLEELYLTQQPLPDGIEMLHKEKDPNSKLGVVRKPLVWASKSLDFRKVREIEGRYPALRQIDCVNSESEFTKAPAVSIQQTYLKDTALTILTILELDGPQNPEVLLVSNHPLLANVKEDFRMIAILAVANGPYAHLDDEGMLVLNERRN